MIVLRVTLAIACLSAAVTLATGLPIITSAAIVALIVITALVSM